MRRMPSFALAYALAALPTGVSASVQPAPTDVACPSAVVRLPVTGCALVHVRIADRRPDDRIGTYVYWLPQAALGAVGHPTHTRGRDTVTIMVTRPDVGQERLSVDTMSVLINAVQPIPSELIPRAGTDPRSGQQFRSDTARLIVMLMPPGSIASRSQATVRMRHVVTTYH